MSHFTAGCPYPHDQCKCYTAQSWSPGAEQPEDARCVNCNQSHGPAVGGSESRVAPGQPADGERSAPPTDCGAYTAVKWPPGDEWAADDRCVNCGQSAAAHNGSGEAS